MQTHSNYCMEQKCQKGKYHTEQEEQPYCMNALLVIVVLVDNIPGMISERTGYPIPEY